METGLRQIDRLSDELEPLRRQLNMLSRRQPGCRALRAACFGIGAVTSVAIWAELGDVRRFASSDTRHLRVHLLAGDLPESWIPPQHVLEARAVVRLYKDLLDERGAWHQPAPA